MDGHEQASYDASMYPQRPTAQTQPTSMADLGTATDSLARLCEDFPAFRIWREIVGDRIQYVARRRHTGVHPHTLVTTDPAKLRAALGAAARSPPGIRQIPSGRRASQPIKVSRNGLLNTAFGS